MCRSSRATKGVTLVSALYTVVTVSTEGDWQWKPRFERRGGCGECDSCYFVTLPCGYGVGGLGGSGGVSLVGFQLVPGIVGVSPSILRVFSDG